MRTAWLTGAAAILLAGLAGIAPPALAQANAAAEPDAQFMGFVRLSRIFGESDFVKQWHNDVNQEFTAREQDLQDRIAKFQKDKRSEGETAVQIVADGPSLAELEREIKRKDRDLAEDKRVRFEEANREVEKIVLKTIREIASQRKVYIVFELSTVLFAEKSLDLTDDVIVALDARGAVTETTTQ